MIHDDGKHLFKCISPFQKTYQVLALEQAWSSCLQKAILPVNVSTSESQKCAPVCHVMCHIYHECNMFDRNIRIVIIQYYMVFTFILLYSACLYTYLYIYIFIIIYLHYTHLFLGMLCMIQVKEGMHSYIFVSWIVMRFQFPHLTTKLLRVQTYIYK